MNRALPRTACGPVSRSARTYGKDLQNESAESGIMHLEQSPGKGKGSLPDIPRNVRLEQEEISPCNAGNRGGFHV